MTSALAAHHRLPSDAIVLGSGSTEVLRMAVDCAVRDSAILVVADPTYEDVVTYAGPWRLPVVRVPLAPDHTPDLLRMLEAAGQGPRLVYLSNPSNPVGTLIARAELAQLVAELPAAVTLVVDEAYHEYASEDPEYASLVHHATDHPNVVVTRTFSKVHGMAGLRIGYGVAHPKTAERLRACQIHHNANHLSVYAALASLNDPEHIAASLRANADTMAFVTSALDELDLAHLPSRTNFVMHEVRGDVAQYVVRMREMHIWVGRPFPPLDGWNRLSIGTRADMERFLDTLRVFRERGWV